MLPVSILCALGNYWLGMKINQRDPQAKAAAYIADMDARIDQFVRQGTFSLGPGHPRPSSMEEAWAQAGQAKQQARKDARRAFNQHTLFWIPMQHWSWVILAFGIFVSVMGLVT